MDLRFDAIDTTNIDRKEREREREKERNNKKSPNTFQLWQVY